MTGIVSATTMSTTITPEGNADPTEYMFYPSRHLFRPSVGLAYGLMFGFFFKTYHDYFDIFTTNIISYFLDFQMLPYSLFVS